MNPSTYICNIEAVVRMGGGSLGNSRGTGAAEKRWNTAAFNGYDKKANPRLAKVKFSSSESINLHPQYGSGSPDNWRKIWEIRKVRVLLKNVGAPSRSMVLIKQIPVLSELLNGKATNSFIN